MTITTGRFHLSDHNRNGMLSKACRGCRACPNHNGIARWPDISCGSILHEPLSRFFLCANACIDTAMCLTCLWRLCIVGMHMCIEVGRLSSHMTSLFEMFSFMWFGHLPNIWSLGNGGKQQRQKRLPCRVGDLLLMLVLWVCSWER